jgi:tellurite resistance protein
VTDRDVVERAQTALGNLADWEKRYGRGINLTPIITDLAAKLTEVKGLCRHALDILEADGEYHAEDLADEVLAAIVSRT